jgi:hypothetical protein
VALERTRQLAAPGVPCIASATEWRLLDFVSHPDPAGPAIGAICAAGNQLVQEGLSLSCFLRALSELFM